jgi:valyl-tRNA synthetase
MKVGRRLAVKLLNASKFALAELPPEADSLAHPLDRAMIARLADVVEEAGASFESYDYARALQRSEELFWWYCDNYLELVKGRRYDPAPAVCGPVSRALRMSLSCFQRLFAPFLPFVCEEVWSWWQEGSIHRASWPQAAPLRAEAASEDEALERLALEVTAEVLAEVRKAKSEARRPMRAPVRRLVVHDTEERLRALALGADDLCSAGSVQTLDTAPAEQAEVEVELADDAT